MTDNNVQDDLQKLIALVTNRSAGLSNDEVIENAISSLLHKNSDMMANEKSTTAHKQHLNQPVIEEDDEDYDNIDEEEEDLQKKPASSTQEKKDTTEPRTSIHSLEEQKKLFEKLNLPEFLPEWNNLESIPLGRTGAKIHITFGDGTQPLPETIALTLLATRNCLQTAIQDARALRRQLVREYQKAKTIVHLSSSRKVDRESLAGEGNMADSIDLDMYFRAIEGTDSLRKDLKVGFDTFSLEKLFPEEMYAYQRWNKMHDAYENAKSDKKEEEEDGEQEDIKEQLKQQEFEKGSTMQERLANFDQRTARMKQNWYLAFSEVRQGSFLKKVGMNSEAQAWEKERAKTSGRGKRREATWEALPASHIQFLHWVGFDQRSALPPPDVATTEALAFLGYNFMGKLVEKAIFIRRLEQIEQMRNHNQQNLGDDFILELPANEQLTKADVEKALLDSTIVPKPLYNSANSVLDSTDAAQIYFGPGFEDRIEMEMEQIFMKKKDTSLPEEEVEIRKQEDKLFGKLKTEPPTVLEGVMDILNNEEKTNEIAEMRSNDQRRRAARDEKTKNKLQDAINNDILPVKRGRGRPRKKKKEEPQKPKRKRGRPSKAQKLKEAEEAKEAAKKAKQMDGDSACLDSDSDSDYCE